MFATGSMQWCWGLDGYNAPVWHTLRTSEVAQQVTRNVLNRMLSGPGERSARQNRSFPPAIVLIALAVAAAFVLRAWISSRMAR